MLNPERGSERLIQARKRGRIRSFLNTRTMVASLAAGIAASTAAVGEYYTHDATYLPRATIEFFSDFNCAYIDPNTQASVALIMDSPDPKQLRKQIGTGERYHQFVLKQAEKFGVDAVDQYPYAEDILHSTTVDQVMEGLNKYLLNFNYRVSIPPVKELREWLTRYNVVSPDEINLERFKSGALSFMNGLFYIPTEVAKLAGPLEFRIVKDLLPGNDGQRTVDGQAIFSTKTVYLDIEGFYDRAYTVSLHEIAHQLDARICGDYGASRDVEYKALNPEWFKYRGKATEGLGDIVLTPYGAKSPVEDKAVLMEYALDGMEGYADLPQIVRRKLELWLSRIESNAARYVGYLRAISKKHFS